MANLVESPILPETHDAPSGRLQSWHLAFPIGAILLGHFTVDTYSSILQPLLGVLQNEYAMKPQWVALLLGLGSVIAGLAQPVFGWCSERFNTRIFGALGIVLGAIGISLIGYSPNIPTVFTMFSIGMLGIGMFHPVAASAIGNLAGDKRGLAISWFFVFGMCGFFVGSLVSPILATGSGDSGLRRLAYLLVPGLVVAAVVQVAIRGVNKRPKHHAGKPIPLRGYHWRSIIVLYFTAVFRFTVNMAMIYLLVRWMEQYVANANPEWTAKTVSDTAASMAGRANATMIAGQGLGGLVAGWLIVAGKEKWPLVATPLLLAPAIASLGYLPPGLFGYAACFLAGIGFAAMTPVAISLGQRLMPHHTTFASGIMLGGAWVIASLGPRLAELLIQHFNLKMAFVVVAVTLSLSGFTALGLDGNSIALRSRSIDE